VRTARRPRSQGSGRRPWRWCGCGGGRSEQRRRRRRRAAAMEDVAVRVARCHPAPHPPRHRRPPRGGAAWRRSGAPRSGGGCRTLVFLRSDRQAPIPTAPAHLGLSLRAGTTPCPAAAAGQPISVPGRLVKGSKPCFFASQQHFTIDSSSAAAMPVHASRPLFRFFHSCMWSPPLLFSLAAMLLFMRMLLGTT
jgi:hypothetical protein